MVGQNDEAEVHQHRFDGVQHPHHLPASRCGGSPKPLLHVPSRLPALHLGDRTGHPNLGLLHEPRDARRASRLAGHGDCTCDRRHQSRRRVDLEGVRQALHQRVRGVGRHPLSRATRPARLPGSSSRRALQVPEAAPGPVVPMVVGEVPGKVDLPQRRQRHIQVTGHVAARGAVACPIVRRWQPGQSAGVLDGGFAQVHAHHAGSAPEAQRFPELVSHACVDDKSIHDHLLRDSAVGRVVVFASLEVRARLPDDAFGAEGGPLPRAPG
mmetsp:Transcript_112907/g.299972  ORF Transcript_112907/g.299972 Transcript_112907/m.299972 type:complete len:268 (-) Transcript_112907:181-984(-)